MRKLIAILFLFISIIGYAQLPEHVEVASEMADTMILINKTDADKINTLFNRYEYADSLNKINENIISTMSLENSKLDSIISAQSSIIINKDEQMSLVKRQNEEAISNLEKQLKRANRGKVIWGVATGASIAGLIFCLIFKK